MSTTEVLRYATLAGTGFLAPWALSRALRAFTIQVEDEEVVLVTSHGRLVDTLKKPGLHVYASRFLPWVDVRRVSLARDFREIAGIHVNDATGTSVVIDLWLEFRIVDAEKAIFAVDDWEQALANVVSHSALSILGNREFQKILGDRRELGELVREDIAAETKRWGVSVDLVMLKSVSLLPELSRTVFETVAARLERAKADIEEDGRLRVALLEAQTSARVAELVAQAKGQYPEAVGRALGELKKLPAVYDAYNELYELSLVRPHRTTAFLGFDALRAEDAAMMTTPTLEAPKRDALPPGGNGAE
jgi:regulator of protease activity HflC (stomatin/prohibitin superfamily)